MENYTKYDLVINIKRGIEIIANARYAQCGTTSITANMTGSIIYVFDKIARLYYFINDIQVAELAVLKY